MIKEQASGHRAAMAQAGIGSAELPRAHLSECARTPLRGRPASVGSPATVEDRAPATDKPRSVRTAADARLRTLVAEHFDFIWRSLRRLGVPHTDVDDCTQQVFWVAARKLEIISEGSERAFLFSTALRVASDARRSRVRRREVQQDDEGHQTCDAGPRPDEIAEQRRARALLDEVLSAMALELRTVFVLFELEEMPTQEIANLLDLPTGTVASRLRRAREEFHKLVGRLNLREARMRGSSAKARDMLRGGKP